VTAAVRTITGRNGTVTIEEHGAGRFFAYTLICGSHASCDGPYRSVDQAVAAGVKQAITLVQRGKHI
jgi:hypothetical protein